MKKLIIKIKSDGTVELKSKGIYGKNCLEYLSIMSKISNARIIDSNLTEDYYQNGSNGVEETIEENIRLQNK